MFEQLDLFNDVMGTQRKEYALPDAQLLLIERFFNQSESNYLFKELMDTTDWIQNEINVYGKTHLIPRLNAWYGDAASHYSYSGIELNPQPWNDALLHIKERVEEASKVRFNSCLINLYRDGRDGVGWHQDNEKILGKNPVIASVSFGEQRVFQLKHIYRKELKRVDIPLNHGCFLLMAGSTQHFWKHQIPKSTKPFGPRINLTFRKLG